MAQRRAPGPLTGELVDRSPKPAAPRRARGLRAPRASEPAEDDAALSGPLLSAPLAGASIAREREADELQPLLLTPRPAEAEGAPRAEPTAPERDFEYAGGVHLIDSVLWFDCDRRCDLSFISHAHIDFVGKNRRILATDKTLKILTRSSGKVEALSSPYRRRFTLGALELEMHPAGHVLGSAQLLIERQGRRIVFTSDVSVRPMATVERARPVECDVLAIPATYGSARFRFPPREEIAEGLLRFVARAFEDNATPVIFADTIGPAQELMRVLGEAGHRLRVHGSIYDVAKVYVEFGVSLPNARRFGGTPSRDEVVIFPPILRKHASIRKLKKPRTAIVSGRAVEPGFAFQQRVDEAFVWADAADFAELLGFIEATGAREIYLTDGYVDELGAELRAKGLRVYPLVPPMQLALKL